MRSINIEVDEEVFAYLQSRATALVDTPNTVLRRELLARAKASRTRGNRRTLPDKVRLKSPPGLTSMPFGTPAALQQILSVIYLVKKNHRPRSEATADVARFVRVMPQTVSDKYGRQLGLTADRFDLLLRESSLTKVEQILKQKFPGHVSFIERFLRSLKPGIGQG